MNDTIEVTSIQLVNNFVSFLYDNIQGPTYQFSGDLDVLLPRIGETVEGGNGDLYRVTMVLHHYFIEGPVVFGQTDATLRHSILVNTELAHRK